MKKQLQQLDKLEGNVDSISNRIANVRTWSYVSNKVNWVENQDYWVERTKNLEDKLSGRLHEELTKSFIDKRASVLARGLKQDITFKTEILENKNVLINKEFIGQLNGLKLELDLKTDALDTDIKSLKKAAKQNVEPEILKRIKQIKETSLIELKDDFKIYWQNFPIAKLSPGKDYLNPEIKLIIDDMVDNIEKINFNKFLHNWINEKINTDLRSLTDLKNINTANTSIRALAYQLYENNGVIKREQVKYFLKKLDQEERKILRNLGVKFGRYHIFLFKLFKPNAVSLRIALWKNFHQKYYNLKPPTFGLNFLKEKKEYSKDFMLLCGFEKFDSFFVRIDILERLFIKIMDLSKENKKEIKLIPEMLNLLGCGKEDFLKLIKKMNYSSFAKNEEIYFKYIPLKTNKKQFSPTVVKKENPFSVLKNINFK
jgi:ATP-dependent RNA helicase SUPV3L1/SUV3